MAEALKIAIDFDSTFTADCQLWKEFILNAQKRGHTVICVSARRNEFSHRQELTAALPEGVEILLSYGTPKRMYAEAFGHHVDIWIDDMPEAIPTKKQLEAMCG
jgi:hypothetical protein